MMILGLDMGTTTFSAVVLDEKRNVVDAVTRNHSGFLASAHPWQRIQDADSLIATAVEVTRALMQKYTVSAIGITGQQHGIVYLDSAGKVLSPLYTWQDGRGNLPYGDGTYLSYLQGFTDSTLAPGYGLVTHFYNQVNGLVPENAAVITTIHDLLAMTLTGGTRPVTEPSDGQSLGFFPADRGDFDREALKKAGMDPAILPEVKVRQWAGYTPEGVPVAVAIGDNPASFLGSVDGAKNPVLLNIGTGSQISIHTENPVRLPGLELRPYPLGGYLLVGAALCGGRAWALTEQFFRSAMTAFTGQTDSLYEKLNALLEETDEEDLPVVETCFDGTRQEPDKRGSIQNLSQSNFTPGKLCRGVLNGMVRELYDLYAVYLNAGLPPAESLIGSGNGLRKNRHLQQITEKNFGLSLALSTRTEEAAAGAAIFAQLLLQQ